MRGATTTAQKRPALITDFNPRTSYEVRLIVVLYPLHHVLFQSTHLMRGATIIVIVDNHVLRRFQPTHLMRGATHPVHDNPDKNPPISIHAPHKRCDTAMMLLIPIRRDFNPRTSCKVRRSQSLCTSVSRSFQSTHLIRGATILSAVSSLSWPISIHAPHAGCDVYATCSALTDGNFNPRTPCGVRPS